MGMWNFEGHGILETVRKSRAFFLPRNVAVVFVTDPGTQYIAQYSTAAGTAPGPHYRISQLMSTPVDPRRVLDKSFFGADRDAFIVFEPDTLCYDLAIEVYKSFSSDKSLQFVFKSGLAKLPYDRKNLFCRIEYLKDGTAVPMYTDDLINDPDYPQRPSDVRSARPEKLLVPPDEAPGAFWDAFLYQLNTQQPAQLELLDRFYTARTAEVARQVQRMSSAGEYASLAEVKRGANVRTPRLVPGKTLLGLADDAGYAYLSEAVQEL